MVVIIFVFVILQILEIGKLTTNFWIQFLSVDIVSLVFYILYMDAACITRVSSVAG